jgi:hypothetical protein
MSPTPSARTEIRFCAKNTLLRTRAVETLGAEKPTTLRARRGWPDNRSAKGAEIERKPDTG